MLWYERYERKSLDQALMPIVGTDYYYRLLLSRSAWYPRLLSKCVAENEEKYRLCTILLGLESHHLRSLQVFYFF